MLRACAVSVALLVVASITGCTGDGVKPFPNMVPVSGTVTLKGKPLPQGTILLAPIDPLKGQSASGQIDDGKFTLSTTVSAPGVMIGKYQVRITSINGAPPVAAMPSKRSKNDVSANPASLIPAKYGDIKTSGLEVEVTKGMKPIQLDLSAN